MDNLIPSSIQGNEDFKHMEDMLTDRLAGLSIEKCVVNLIDITEESALYSLIRQWNVAGYKGGFFYNTASGRRALIKRAFIINSKAGTPGAIRQTFALLGLVTEFFEGSSAISTRYPDFVQTTYWYNYAIHLGYISGGVSADLYIAMLETNNAFKNARSELVFFSIDIDDPDNQLIEQGLLHNWAEASDPENPGEGEDGVVGRIFTNSIQTGTF